MHESEKDLILLAQQGSVTAFEQLINPFEKAMLGMASSLACFPDDADDIYQDAMIAAYQSLAKFKMQSRFSTWLYRILVNTAISRRRKLKNKLSRLIFNESTVAENEVGQSKTALSLNNYTGNENADDDPEAKLINQQLSQAIQQALIGLSEKEKIAFILCHQQELKINQSAQVMECSEGAVKSYLFRAREKMRDQLKQFKR